MKALTGTWLLVAAVFVACGTSSDPNESTPRPEGASGSSGPAGVKSGGAGDIAGSQSPGAGGGGGKEVTIGSGGASSMGGAGGAASASTPCPPDAPASCPQSGGFTAPCGAGHCVDGSGKKIAQTTTYDTCHPDRIPGMGAGHPVNDMKGKFLPTLHGNEGDDDQCKYHVKVAVDTTAKNQDVTFTLNATNLGDDSLVKDNDPTPAVDVFLTASHLAPKTDVKSMMTSPGTFKVGPVRFDQCGEWTARFHFFNHCGNDFVDSPYASIAFYVNVP